MLIGLTIILGVVLFFLVRRHKKEGNKKDCYILIIMCGWLLSICLIIDFANLINKLLL